MTENPTIQKENPAIGLGDLFRLLEALSEAVLTGATEVPMLTFRVAGRTVEYGPSPITIK